MKRCLFIPLLLYSFSLPIIRCEAVAREMNKKVDSYLLSVGERPPRDIKIHNMGNLWSAISNFGSYGDCCWESTGRPSCEWPGGSGNHYLFEGSLWVGTVVGADTAVSSYFFFCRDWLPSEGSTFELGPGLSDQDSYTEYDDLEEDPFHNHIPLGIKVAQRGLSWSASEYGDFIIFDYTIHNIGLRGDLQNVYIGWWFDFDVSSWDTTDCHRDDLVDYDIDRAMSYMYDADDPETPEEDTGENGRCTGYVGIRLLRGEPFSHAWWPNPDDPGTDLEQYEYMAAIHPSMRGEHFMPNPTDWGLPPSDYRVLLSAGPYNIDSGDTLQLATGLVIGEGLEGLGVNADRMKDLYDSLHAVTNVDFPHPTPSVPEEFALSQNYPNPFNPYTEIRYQIPAPSRDGIGNLRSPVHTTLKIYNLLGQEVRTLVDEAKEAGYYTVRWDGRDSAGNEVASGIYFYRIEAGQFQKTKRMLLVK
ncbi:MAG: FlgD immunoglobulin-like domain containing protein [bacterium]